MAEPTRTDLPLVLLRGADQELALRVEQVERVVRWHEPRPLPGVPLGVIGALPMEPGPVPVLDLARRLGRGADARPAGPHAGPRNESAPELRVVVARMGDRRLGLLARGAQQVATLPSDALAELPALLVPLTPGWVHALVRCGDGRLALLVDPAALLDADEWERIGAALRPDDEPGGGAAGG